MKPYDIFVSPSGSDSNQGSAELPLKTPQAAKAKAALLKNADCGHVTVWFGAGRYEIDETLAFGKNDLSDVTYRSVPGEKVIFSGAKEISGFTATTVNGVRAFVTDWEVNSDSDYFNSLYNGDKRLSRPVYPQKGEFSIAEALDADALACDTELFKLHAAFFASPTDLKNFKNVNDVDVRILHYWNDELLPIHSLNTVTGRIETKKPASMTVNKGERFLFENVFEALCEPGEFYLDRAQGKLYYVPFEGEQPETTVLMAGVTERLIMLDGCQSVEFRGIDFCDSEWEICSGKHFADYLNEQNPLVSNISYAPNFPQACFDQPCAVTVNNSEAVSFVDCGFIRIGSSALMFGEGSRGCTARACLFDNIGGNAVYIKGVNQKGAAGCTSGITVTDCHIKTYGRIFNNAIGVLLVHASDCVISQNEIHDGFYTAISVGWIWGYTENITDNILVENNLIYDIGQGWLSDMGGIYTLGIQPHTVLRGNIVHDVGCYAGGSGYGGWGIYLDEGSSEILVENNIAYHCSSQGFHQHYGRDNLIRNNIFALNSDGQLRISRKEDHNSITLERNILLSDDSPIYYEPVKDQFIDKDNIMWDLSHKGAVLSGIDTSCKKSENIIDMKFIGYYKGSVFADPYFKDAENGDFTLALNSPALLVGFEPIDFSAAGTLTRFFD